MENISIQTEYIRLDALLKFAGLAVTGGEAKQHVADGLVSVNGEPCRQRGRKIHPGDIVAFGGRTYCVRETGHDGI
jgi:ribosome-associated protein